MSTFTYDILKNDKFLHVFPKGRIMEQDQTDQLIEDIAGIINENYNQVILDLEQLNYINSSGLNAFIHILTKARNLGGEAIIINVPETIKKLLLISKLNTVFTIRENLEDVNEILN